MSSNAPNPVQISFAEPNGRPVHPSANTTALGMLRLCFLWTLCPFVVLWVIIFNILLFWWVSAFHGMLLDIVLERFLGKTPVPMDTSASG